MTQRWQETFKNLLKFKILPLNLCTKRTFEEAPRLSPAESAIVENSITPQPTPASTRMYSMSVESVAETERILWTGDTTSPFKPAEQTAWLTSCLHIHPLTFTLHWRLIDQASVSTLRWDMAGQGPKCTHFNYQLSLSKHSILWFPYRKTLNKRQFVRTWG